MVAFHSKNSALVHAVWHLWKSLVSTSRRRRAYAGARPGLDRKNGAPVYAVLHFCFILSSGGHRCRAPAGHRPKKVETNGAPVYAVWHFLLVPSSGHRRRLGYHATMASSLLPWQAPCSLQPNNSPMSEPNPTPPLHRTGGWIMEGVYVGSDPQYIDPIMVLRIEIQIYI